VLQQPTDEDPKLMRPVVYFSQKLKAAQRNYAANEREFLATVAALQEWRCYVEGLHVDLYTDHKPLTHISDQTRVATRLQRWA
jgi:RNase H-like domain found in reverse transcriptase